MNKETVTTTKVKRPYKRTGKFSKRRGPRPVKNTNTVFSDDFVTTLRFLGEMKPSQREAVFNLFN